jgi:hypothetical protein
MSFDGKYFSIQVGPYRAGAVKPGQYSIEAMVTAADPAGNRASPVHFYRLGTYFIC